MSLTSSSTGCSMKRAQAAASCTRSVSQQQRPHCTQPVRLSTQQPSLNSGRKGAQQASHVAHASAAGPVAPSQRDSIRKLDKVCPQPSFGSNAFLISDANTATTSRRYMTP